MSQRRPFDAEGDKAVRTDVIRAHAVLLGERIATQGLAEGEVYSTTPLSFHSADGGFVVVFRYGAVVLIGGTGAEETRVIQKLLAYVSAPTEPVEEEIALIGRRGADEDTVTPGGTILVKERSPERLSIIADALAKSVALAHHEREVALFFDAMEPVSRALRLGAAPQGGRKSFLQLIGSALMIQNRVSARVAARDKPDLLWDHPELERLYARLEAEYELIERAETLDRKLQAVGATASAMIDLQDTQRSQRLEALVVILILVEVSLSIIQIYLAARP